MVALQTTRKQVAIVRNRQLNKENNKIHTEKELLKIPGKEEKINRDHRVQLA